MNVEIGMALEFERVNASSPAKQYIIWMHGLGADGFDFMPLVPQLNLPNTTFIFPHAPMRPITINNGYTMRGWYDIFALDRLADEDEQGLLASREQIHDLIEMLLKEGVDSRNIILAGFSQGGAMALLTGLTFEQPLKAIVALSCYLPLQGQWPGISNPANQKTPILMVHGKQDDMLPFSMAVQHAGLLKEMGYNVTWRDYPMGHTVCAPEVADIRAFCA